MLVGVCGCIMASHLFLTGLRQVRKRVHCFIAELITHSVCECDARNAIKYNLEWAAAVCTAVPHLSVQFVLSLDHFSVPSVLPRRDRFDQFNTALS